MRRERTANQAVLRELERVFAVMHSTTGRPSKRVNLPATDTSQGARDATVSEMTQASASASGVVHGRTVELDEPVQTLEGKRVRVTLVEDAEPRSGLATLIELDGLLVVRADPIPSDQLPDVHEERLAELIRRVDEAS